MVSGHRPADRYRTSRRVSCQLRLDYRARSGGGYQARSGETPGPRRTRGLGRLRTGALVATLKPACIALPLSGTYQLLGRSAIPTASRVSGVVTIPPHPGGSVLGYGHARTVVTGLHFLACRRCDTVHAEPLVPPRCRSCSADALVDITARVQADRYFSRPTR